MFDDLLMTGIGILAVLMGAGKIPVSKDPSKNQQYLSKFGKLLRVCGIILIVAGILLTLSSLLRS